uniref:PiggyBac transposable element derived 5 n=1 Tax=Eptatretus burgeri TaxID=7764 RepID=A0A8C4WYB3_EPTBU
MHTSTKRRFGNDPGWRDTNLAEMRAFLGLVASTAVHHSESVLSIWGGGFFGNGLLAKVMPQDRFEKLLKYFHVVAFRSTQSTDGLYKVQPFLDALQSGFDAAFQPSQTQVLHEPLIEEDLTYVAAWAGLDGERRRRKKRKFSLWVRQCTTTGFICQMHVYLKANSDALEAFRNRVQLHSLVAKHLCVPLPPHNYIIFCGPSITSLQLFQEFEKKGIYCCGLLSSRKSDCTGLPRSALVSPVLPLPRGQYSSRMKGTYSITCWANKGVFRFLTNAYSPLKRGVIIKRKGGNLQEMPCPQAVEAFAAHLSYICKYDDKYSRYFITHKPNKTWQQIFWLALSITMNNAYVLYKLSAAYARCRYSRTQFGQHLMQELLGPENEVPPEKNLSEPLTKHFNTDN